MKDGHRILDKDSSMVRNLGLEVYIYAYIHMCIHIYIYVSIYV